MRRLLACACWLLACGVAMAQLSESEKQLLRGALSSDAAEAAGRSGDAATLERIVALGDPKLVPYFGTGMMRANPYAMAPAVEAVIVRHFDHPVMGAALRALPGKYASRALFDLHLARLKAAYRSDEPSFEQILRTEQAGIEEELLANANHFPARNGQLPGAVDFLARRKHPGAIPYLLAGIEPGYTPPYNTSRYNAAFDFLTSYNSEDAWRKAGAEIERMNLEGKLREDQYAYAREKLDGLLKDPQKAIGRMQAADSYAEFSKRRQAIVPGAMEVHELQKRSPREYVEAQVRYVEQVERLAAEYDGEQVRAEPGFLWASLGVYTRFKAKDPVRAVTYLAKAAKARNLVGQFVLGDTYQFALKDTAAAIRAYEAALDTASRQPPGLRVTPYAPAGTPMNDFWRAWLAAEIEYLRTGKRFAGRVSESVISGFWEATMVWAQYAAQTFPEFPIPDQRMQYARAGMSARGGLGMVAAPDASPTWKSVEYALGTIDRATLAQRLQAVPASRYALLVTLRETSALASGDAILRELARSDPSGFWTTVILGTIAWHEGTPARRDEALADGLAQALPGMAAPGKPNPLAAAARKHMEAQSLRVVQGRP